MVRRCRRRHLWRVLLGILLTGAAARRWVRRSGSTRSGVSTRCATAGPSRASRRRPERHDRAGPAPGVADVGSGDAAQATRHRSCGSPWRCEAGVSLAVWIGGAVAELDLLRRGVLAAEAARGGLDDARSSEQFFAGLPEGTALDGERVKIVRPDRSGPSTRASASTCSPGPAPAASTRSCTASRRPWGSASSGCGRRGCAEGDLWTLMRPGWRPGEAFRVAVAARGRGPEARTPASTRRCWTRSASNATDPSATRSIAEPRVGQPGGDPRGRAADAPQRRTRPPARPRRTSTSARCPGRRVHAAHDDMPGDASDDLPICRLAYAARTTSSFPGAFEPALLWSTPDVAAGAAGRRERRRSTSTARSRRPRRCRVDERPALLRVFDGGVFDNIPIARALDAIADMPADVGVERHLFYLDPDPRTSSSLRSGRGTALRRPLDVLPDDGPARAAA